MIVRNRPGFAPCPPSTAAWSGYHDETIEKTSQSNLFQNRSTRFFSLLEIHRFSKSQQECSLLGAVERVWSHRWLGDHRRGSPPLEVVPEHLLSRCQVYTTTLSKMIWFKMVWQPSKGWNKLKSKALRCYLWRHVEIEWRRWAKIVQYPRTGSRQHRP